MKKEEIAKILDKWWHDDDICSNENLCAVNCDLCTTCFQNLCERFGCSWNDNYDDTVREESEGKEEGGE